MTLMVLKRRHTPWKCITRTRNNKRLQVTSPPPLECVPLVLAARQSMERESRRSSSRDPEAISMTGRAR